MSVAPPKRKTGGGRVTPKGTRPGGHLTKSTHTDEVAANERGGHLPTASSFDAPRWPKYVGLPLIGAAAILIVVRNLAFPSDTWSLLAAVVALLVGLWALTKWR